jgi:hypothetical protein
MNCYVHVLPHPYFAVTDKDGNFTIKGLPAAETECLQAVEALCLRECATACLLHNDPASYRVRRG